MSKQFLSVADVAQIAIERVDSLMHLPQVGAPPSSLSTVSVGESADASEHQGASEAGAMPDLTAPAHAAAFPAAADGGRVAGPSSVTQSSQGSSDGAHAERKSDGRAGAGFSARHNVMPVDGIGLKQGVARTPTCHTASSTQSGSLEQSSGGLLREVDSPAAGDGAGALSPEISVRLSRARDYASGALSLVSLARTELSVLNLDPLDTMYSVRDFDYVAGDLAKFIRWIESDLRETAQAKHLEAK